MKKNEIKIGGIYIAKVSDKLTRVRIERENPRGGWDAVNLTTQKKIRVKSAQRLRRPATAEESKTAARHKAAKGGFAAGEKAVLRAQAQADQENARLRDERKASPDGQSASERAMAQSAPEASKPTKTARDAKAKPQRDTGERRATKAATKPLSLLDAAAHLLSLGAGDPMRCQDIVDLAAQRGLWTPRTGKTPANTLYSALTREIKTKGDASRFVKAERGKFALAK